MICPKCHAEMTALLVEEIAVERCDRCGGLWFDQRGATPIRQVDPAAAAAIDTGPSWQATIHNEQGKVFCPHDETLMRRLTVPDRPGMWVERCPTCRGTFFDAGEFSQLTDREIGMLVRSSGAYRAP
jgi:Zn-finger nucleic acid-binding protein